MRSGLGSEEREAMERGDNGYVAKGSWEYNGLDVVKNQKHWKGGSKL